MSLAASALFFALFARVRGRGILRTSPVRGSRFPLGEGFLTPETLAAVATELLAMSEALEELEAEEGGAGA